MGIAPVLGFSLLSLALQAPGPIARMTYDLKGIKNQDYKKQVQLREFIIVGLSFVSAIAAQTLGPLSAKKIKPLGKLANKLGDTLFRSLLLVPTKIFTEAVSRMFTHAQAKELVQSKQQDQEATASDLAITIPDEAIHPVQQLLFKGDRKMKRYPQYRLPLPFESSQYLESNKLYITA